LLSLNLIEVIENYRHEDLVRDNTGLTMQLDVYLPRERLAFEYQGEQHYYNIYPSGKLETQKEKDLEKRKSCQINGITLIEIPYWWDYQKSSLITTMYAYRPDLLLPSSGDPIPSEPIL
jgi:hypothetical protein